MEIPVRLSVRLWGEELGVLTWDQAEGRSLFKFSDGYFSKPFDVAPLVHPKSKPEARGLIPGGEKGKYKGLPEFIADSLPDDWGNLLFDAWARRNRLSHHELSPILKLSFIGKRGMGALEFIPENRDAEGKTALDIEELYDMSMRLYRERAAARINPGEEVTFRRLIRLGTSAGGMRPKSVIAIDGETGEIRSGQVDLPPSYRHYILKFQEDSDVPTTLVEYAYYRLALECGIKMMPSRLFPMGSMRHFLTERFDRQNGEKQFTQTLAALMPEATDYNHIFYLLRVLRADYPSFDQLFRRLVFNVLAGNTDDHSKNFSFIMDPSGRWELAPAYDLTFTSNAWEDFMAQYHSLSVRGKKTGISREDLIEIGEANGIRRCKPIVKQISMVIGGMESLFDEIGITGEWKERILSEVLPGNSNQH